MVKEVDLLIIGRGLAGHAVLDNYLNYLRRVSQIPTVEWVGPDPLKDVTFTCSIKTTAMAALQGVRKYDFPVPLGDVLFDSYEKMRSFIDRNQPYGVEKARRYHLVYNDETSELLKKRFRQATLSVSKLPNISYCGIDEECFLFEAKTFLSWWSDKLFPAVDVTPEFAVKVEKYKEFWLVETQTKKFLCKQVAVCGGALSQLMPVIRNDRSKVVPGHYLQWNNVDMERMGIESSMVICLDDHNLMFRKKEKTVMLSGTNEVDGLLAKKIGIYHYLERFKEFVPQYIPETEPELLMGIRQKGRKRLPSCQEIDYNLFRIDGLYKNGFSYCHEVGSRFVSLLANSNR